MLLKSGLLFTLCLFTLQASRIKGKRGFFFLPPYQFYCLCCLEKEMFASTVARKSGTRSNSTFLRRRKTGGDPLQALLGFKVKNVCV